MAGSAPAAAAQASGGSGAFLRRSVLQQRRHVYHEQRRRKCGGPRLLQNRHASRQVASRWQAEEHAEEAEAEEEQREEQRGRDTQAAGAHPGEEAQLEPFQEQQRERVRARQRGLLAQRRAGAGQLRGLRLQRVQRNHAQRQALQQLVLILRAPAPAAWPAAARRAAPRAILPHTIPPAGAAHPGHRVGLRLQPRFARDVRVRQRGGGLLALSHGTTSRFLARLARERSSAKRSIPPAAGGRAPHPGLSAPCLRLAASAGQQRRALSVQPVRTRRGRPTLFLLLSRQAC